MNRLELRPRPGQRAGRAFSVAPFAIVTAASMGSWGFRGQAERDYRPVYLSYAGTVAEVRAFTANLRSGRVAVMGGPSGLSLSIPRGQGFRWKIEERAEGAAIGTVYCPPVIDRVPAFAIDPDWVTGVCLVPRWWVDREVARLLDRGEYDRQADAEHAAVSLYLASFVSSRSTFPVYPGLEFYRGLRIELENRFEISGSCSVWDSAFRVWTAGPLFKYVARLRITTEQLGELLADVTQAAVEQGTVTRVEIAKPRERRVLPLPECGSGQIELFGTA